MIASAASIGFSGRLVTARQAARLVAELMTAITAGGEFQLALIERPLVMPRHFKFPRACYRDQILVCLACATSIKAVRHDRTA